jgi:hypothetical protein
MSLSNAISSPPLPSDSKIGGLVQSNVSLSGHSHEIDDTIGNERQRWSHPGGTHEEWTNGGRNLIVQGDGYTAILGDNEIQVMGNVNIIVQGDCNTVVNGNYNLNVLGDMNVAVKGKSIYKNDGPIYYETTAGDMAYNIGGSYKVIVQDDHIHRVKGDYDANINGNYDLTVAGSNETIIFGNSLNIVNGDTLLISAGTHKIGAASYDCATSGTQSYSGSALNILKGNVVGSSVDIISKGITLANHKHGGVYSGASDTVGTSAA